MPRCDPKKLQTLLDEQDKQKQKAIALIQKHQVDCPVEFAMTYDLPVWAVHHAMQLKERNQ